MTRMAGLPRASGTCGLAAKQDGVSRGNADRIAFWSRKGDPTSSLHFTTEKKLGRKCLRVSRAILACAPRICSKSRPQSLYCALRPLAGAKNIDLTPLSRRRGAMRYAYCALRAMGSSTRRAHICEPSARPAHDGQSGRAPLRKPVLEPTNLEATRSQHCYSFIGEYAVGPATVSNNLLRRV